MATEDPMVMPLAIELLDCLNQEIQKVADPPKHVQLRTGEVVVADLSSTCNECCEGLAWVRVSGFYPAGVQFPAQDEVLTQKGVTGWAITLEMGVLRCAPTPEPDECITAEQHMALAQAVQDDAAAMRRAMCCFIESTAVPSLRAQQVVPGLWQPTPTEGGCAGGILPVTVRAPACDCAEAGPVS